MKSKQSNFLKTVMVALVVLLTHVACKDELAPPSSGGGTSSGSTSGSGGTGGTGYLPPQKYVQIERLARPAINEGLIYTNAFLNAFNSIPPSLDLSDAAAPVRAEAVKVLSAVHKYAAVDNGITSAPEVDDVATGFLPDVMRIDTRTNLTVAQWAYNGDFTVVSGTSAAAMLTGGRKIEDDVMDITLSYLIAGAPACGPGAPCAISDGVSYDGGTTCASAGQGANVANPGHKCLLSQTARNGSSTFPFLAEPH